jgi:hypothetical protein
VCQFGVWVRLAQLISRGLADDLADGFVLAMHPHDFFLPSWRVGSFGEFRRLAFSAHSAAASPPATIPRRDARTIAHDPFLENDLRNRGASFIKNG